MGLGLVETIYRIEEEFDIKIPEKAAITFVTPKTIIDYLMTRPELYEKWSREYIALSIWQAVEDVTGINEADYNENLRFIEDLNMD